MVDCRFNQLTTGRGTVKSTLLKGLTLVAFLTLVGCTTYGNAPSEIEKRFYKECQPNPPQVPCGYH
jgi:hypothetical protein